MSEITEAPTTAPDYAPLFAALAKAQGSFPVIPRDKTVKVTMKSGGTYTFAYAPLDTILAAVRPHLSANGLAVMQTLENGDVWTIITHSSGVQIKLAPVKALQTESGPQALGSALTYARRYSVTLALNLAADEDDDANGAQGNKSETQGKKQDTKQQKPAQQAQGQQATKEPATQEQLAKIQDLMSAIIDRDGGTDAATLQKISTFSREDGTDFYLKLEKLTPQGVSKGYAGKIIGKAEGMLKPPQ